MRAAALLSPLLSGFAFATACARPAGVPAPDGGRTPTDGVVLGDAVPCAAPVDGVDRLVDRSEAAGFLTPLPHSTEAPFGGGRYTAAYFPGLVATDLDADGALGFALAAVLVAPGEGSRSQVALMTDVDRDGDRDVVVFPHQGPPVAFYENDGAPASWVDTAPDRGGACARSTRCGTGRRGPAGCTWGWGRSTPWTAWWSRGRMGR